MAWRVVRVLICHVLPILGVASSTGVSLGDEVPTLAERFGLGDFDPFENQPSPLRRWGLLGTTYDRHISQGKDGGFVELTDLDNPVVVDAATMPLRFDKSRNAVFSGQLLVPATGKYAFRTISKWGKRNALYLDGRLVVPYGTGPKEDTEIELKRGECEIAVVGYVASAGLVQVDWRRPGEKGFEPIEDRYLVHHRPHWLEPPTIEPDDEMTRKMSRRFRQNPRRKIPSGADAFTAAQQFDLQRTWRRAVFVENYREYGNHDPRWDEDVLAMITTVAEARSATEDFDWATVAVGADTVLETPCTDLLALTFAGEYLLATKRADDAETIMKRAQDEFERTRYPAVTRSFARIAWSLHRANTARSKGLDFVPLAEDFVEAARSDLVGMAKSHFLRNFNARLGKSEEARVEVLRRLLASTDADPWMTRMLLARHHRKLAWAYGRNRRDDFSRHMVAAKAHALAAWDLHPEYPEAATLLIQLWDEDNNKSVADETPRFWFDEAVAACLDHTAAYTEYLDVLRDERWRGYEQLHAFGRECLATGRFDTAVPGVLLRSAAEYADDNRGYEEDLRRANLVDDLEKVFNGYSKVDLDPKDEMGIISHLFALTSILKGPEGVRELAGYWGGRYNLAIFGKYDIDFARTWNEVFSPSRYAGHEDWVGAIRATPDGSKVLSIGRSLRVWDRTSGELLRELSVHRGAGTDIRFSPDGKSFAISSFDGTVKLLDSESYETIRTLEHGDEVYNVAFSPDGKWLAVGQGRKRGFEPGRVTIWNVATGKKVKDLPDQQFAGLSVAFSPDGKTLATSDSPIGDYRAGDVKLWDTSDWSLQKTLQPTKGTVTDIHFVGDGTLAVLGRHVEGTKVTYGTRMVDVATGEDLRIIKEFRAHHGCSAISPDGRLLAMGVSELYRAEGINNPGLLGGESVGLYDLKTGERLATMRGLAKQATMLAFSPDSRSLLVAEGSTGAIHEFKIEDPVRGQLHGHLRPFKDTIGPQVDYSPDGRLLATAGGRFVHVWDAKTLTGRRTIAATAESIIHVEFSPDSKRIATVGGRLGWGRDDKRLQIWDAETGEFLWGHASPGNHHWSVAYSPDGKRLATGHRTGSILVHDLDAGEIVARVQVRNVPDAMVRTIAFHPDGERLAAGNASGEIILFRIPEKTGANVPILEELARWKGHEKLVYRIAFNPDGSLLGTGDFHGTAVVWDTNTRKAIHRVVGNEIVFSPDGTRFVASGRGTTKDARPEAYGVRIHDTKTGAVLVTTRRGHYHPIISVDWSHDGKRLVTGGGDWVAAVWDAKTGEGDWSILPDDDE